MVHHRRRGRIVAMGVSAEALSSKCDTSERARLRTVLIMIVNNNRARHRRLPDVTRALYRLRTPPSAQNQRRRLDRRGSDYLSIISTHTHVHNWLLILRRVATVYYSRRPIVPAGGPVDLTGRISLTSLATMRANSARASEFSRVRTCRTVPYRHSYSDISGARSTTGALGSNL